MSEIDTPAVDSAVDVRPIDSDAGSVPVVRPVVVAGARSAEEIRADLAAYTVAFNNTEWSREVWLVNVGHTAVVVCESVPSLLAEVEAVKRDRARLIAELHGAHRERDSLRGVVQAVEAALRDIDKAVVTTDASKRLALFHATDTIRAALAAAADAPQPELPTWRCKRCGSDRWVAASLTGPDGPAIKQCVPCGRYSGDRVHPPAVLPEKEQHR